MVTTSPSRRRVIAAGLIGNVLEWYDFAVYGYLAPVLGMLFFPSDDPITSLIAAFGAFAAGFLMRPIGGIVLGHIGDRFGRRRALTISVIMMAVPTFMMGLLPPAAEIGIAAAVLVVILRLVQGLSVGGEYVGSFAFLTEQAPAGRRNFYASWSLVGGVSGVLLGSAVAAFVSEITTDDQMLEWGWRVPFLLGVAVALVALFVRRGINETPTRTASASAPIIEAARTSWRRLLQVAGLSVLTAVIFYTAFIYVATWIVEQTGMTHARALDINTISMVVIIVVLPFAGMLTDRVGCRPVLMGASAAFVLLSYPLVWMMHHDSFTIILAGQAGIAVMIAFYAGAVPVTMAALFPRHIRMSAMGFGYNVTYAVLGGTAPVVAAWLVSVTGDAMAFSWYMILAAAVSCAVVITLPAAIGRNMDA